MNKSILAVIPARGGSKGIPKKNIVGLGGRPLIAYTIKESMKTSLISQTIVSTDSQEIADIAIENGANVPFLRPAELSDDKAKSIDVAMHALSQSMAFFQETYDIFLLLQPTSPFRTAAHIENVINILIENKNAESVISVNETPNSYNPNYIYHVNKDDSCQPVNGQNSFERRQDMKKTFVRNGAIYAVRVDYLVKNNSLVSKENYAYIMDEKSSVNVDTPFDLLLAETILKGKK